MSSVKWDGGTNGGEGMAVDLGSLFARYGWTAGEREPGLWAASFAVDSGEEFDLFAFVREEWIHFGVPALTPTPAAEAAPRLHRMLLRLNQGLPLVRFTLDADGDVSLQADMPVHRFTFDEFALVLDMLTSVVESWQRALERMAVDNQYVPPEFGDL